jgi:DNA-binding protein HU-beta
MFLLFMAKGLSKSQLIAALADASGLSKKDAGSVYETLVNIVYKQVKSAGEQVLPGLGKMVKQNRPARQGRNPATGASITIPAKTVVKFRLNKAAKEAIL